jgi:predicted ATPase
VRADLPTGTLTFLFTDVEGSTKLLHELGGVAYAEALAEHRRIVRDACAHEGGVEVDTQGDAFFFAFPSAEAAVSAAQEITDGLSVGPMLLRIGLHTGTPLVTDEGYVGDDVHLAARIAAAGHGGQVLLSSASRELVDGRSISDLGEHRLKDIEGAVSIYQLGSQRFPPLKTISNTNLPRPASSFVGRQRERDELVAMLSDGTRLLTLSGPGGSGKTRLAIEAASELVPAFKAGVFWVGLSALRDPALVTQTIAQAIGAKEDLAAHVSERELLLLLDNFEQVVEAAPGLSQLLEACPNLRLLVTSRELLRIRGEVEYPVSPLSEPEAVALFCERARLEPDETIAELCRHLDDMPLAVELAAARTSVLTPTQIVDRLAQRLDLLKGGRDADPRQQTLRATIEWSHDLLDETEKQLFARFAVFAGGCTLDAAQEICAANLAVLQSLVDKSLLRHSGDRFWMLETIREFAVERLEHLADADQTHERHARWYTWLAKKAHEDAVLGVIPRRLDAELENFRSAISWTCDHDERLEVELVEATWRFLAERGLLREVLGYLVHALGAAESAAADQAELLGGAVYVGLRTGDYADAERWGEKRLALSRSRGEPPLIASSLAGLALTLEQTGEFERARKLYLEGAGIARECAEVDVLGVIAYNLGEIDLIEGEVEGARMRFQEVLELVRERHAPDPGGEAFGYVGLSLAALAEEDTDAAAAALGRALRLASNVEVRELIFSCLLGSAEVAALRSKSPRAARLLGAADALRAEIGYIPSPLERRQRRRITALLDDDAAASLSAQSEGQALTLEQAVAYALDQDG